MHEVERLRKLVQDQRDRIETLEAEKDRTWTLLEELRGKEPEPSKEPERKGLWGRVFGSLAVMVLVGGLAQPSLGYTGNDWLGFSEEEKVGYVVGAYDGFRTVTAGDDTLAWMSQCIEDKWTPDQMVAVLEKFLEENPEKRHYLASDELYLAILEACPSAP